MAYFLPVLSGILLSLSFPKPDIGFLAWAALVPLLYALDGTSPGKAFRLSFISGLIYYLLTIYWILGTMSHYGGLPYPVGALLLVALSAYLALYFGAFGVLVSATRASTGVPVILAAPVYWTALELARNYMLTGFPWDQLGYSQAVYPAVIQMADITGVYGISAVIVLVNCALAGFALMAAKKAVTRRSAVSSLIVAAIFLASVLAYGRYSLSHPPAPSGSMKVALIQGNIEQFAKWDPAYQEQVFDTYKELTMSAAVSRPGLIIWPETATPFYFQDEEKRQELEKLAVDAGTYILTGSPSYEHNPDGSLTDYNSAFLISPEGKVAGRYDKMHLVPFGEYVPLKKFLPFVSRMVQGIGDFGSGKACTTIKTPKGAFGTAICFEAIFPELVRQFPECGAEFLVNITNDAWFGATSAPYQHFNMALMRAVENRRTLVRAANTGISGVITPLGIVSARTDIFTRGYVVRDIELVRQMSFYTLHGDLFAYACASLSIVFIVLIVSRQRYNIKAQKTK